MVGLVDCNNFFVSCERVFNPSLQNKPVVVLSNNDGCVVAMSNEAKKIGIKRGMPYFKIKSLIEVYDIAVFSSNYQLYADISSRIMTILSSFVDDIEIYSIDEAFIHIPHQKNLNLQAFAEKISKTVFKCIGVPISIGISSTKTLAKLAITEAKKNALYNGIFIIDTDKKRKEILTATSISNIWGIGRSIIPKFHDIGIYNACEFAEVSCLKFHDIMNSSLVKTWKELNGQKAIKREVLDLDRRNICCSRTFSILLTEMSELQNVFSNFVEVVASKLKRQKGLARSIVVFIQTDTHKTKLSQYHNSYYYEFKESTNDFRQILFGVLFALKSIYRKGYEYKRTGIIVQEIEKPTLRQSNLFIKDNVVSDNRLNDVISIINSKQSTLDKIHVASSISNTKPIKQCLMSRLYTTNFNEIIEINCTTNK